MMTVRRLLAVVVCALAVVHGSLVAVTDAENLGALRNYLNLARQEEQQQIQGSQVHHLARRLPPLVPHSFGDDDHFDERQVYSIPRVGKSIENDDLYTLGDGPEGGLSAVEDEFTGPGRGEQVRQVFSKIPRVGRSTRAVRSGTRAGA